MAAYDPNAPVYATVVTGEVPAEVAHVVGEAMADQTSAGAKKMAGAAAESSVFGPPSCSEEEAIAGLIARGMPPGLAEVVWSSANNCAIRLVQDVLNRSAVCVSRVSRLAMHAATAILIKVNGILWGYDGT